MASKRPHESGAVKRKKRKRRDDALHPFLVSLCFIGLISVMLLIANVSNLG